MIITQTNTTDLAKWYAVSFSIITWWSEAVLLLCVHNIGAGGS